MRRLRYAFVVIISGGVALLVGGAVVALAMDGASGNRATPARSPTLALLSHSRRITAIPEDEASAFGILRRAQVTSDLLPEDRWGRFEMGFVARLGLNPALMRRARTEVGNVWVVPGDGWICLALAASRSVTSLDGGGIECNTIKSAARGRTLTWTSSSSGDQTIVQGLVPDGVREVILTARDGASKTVPVADNVYGSVLDGGLASVRLGGPRGPIVLSL
jgi:hypothetical protein